MKGKGKKGGSFITLWLWSFVNEMRGKKDEPLRLNCDNQGAIALAKDNKFHSQTKHIDL